jgi:glutathione peroxidase
MTDAPVYDVPVNRIDGSPSSLGDFEGKALLVVNVASACGLTPQYAGLQDLHARYRDRGFAVLGFPANDFGAQEPGSNEEIADFCSTKFGVDFPMFEKITVKGPAKHELYRRLIEAQPRAADRDGGDFKKTMEGYGMKIDDPSEIMWNFEKFLVDRDGAVIARFMPDVTPEDPALVAAVEKALAE